MSPAASGRDELRSERQKLSYRTAPFEATSEPTHASRVHKPDSPRPPRPLPPLLTARNFKLLDELEDAEKSAKGGADISLGLQRPDDSMLRDWQASIFSAPVRGGAYATRSATGIPCASTPAKSVRNAYGETCTRGPPHVLAGGSRRPSNLVHDHHSERQLPDAAPDNQVHFKDRCGLRRRAGKCAWAPLVTGLCSAAAAVAVAAAGGVATTPGMLCHQALLLLPFDSPRPRFP